VLPFNKFPGIDPTLGPEMKSTGEVMGIDADFPRSFAKSQEASGLSLPSSGAIFVSVRDEDKPEMLQIARSLKQMGFSLVATRNTHQFLSRHGIDAARVAKIGEGKPDVVDLIKQKNVCLVINTPSGKRSRADGYAIRRTALELNVPCITNIHSCQAAVHAIAVAKESTLGVKPIQDYYRELPYRLELAKS
jgi:carbamoyl-phosphate synthase large subunit